MTIKEIISQLKDIKGNYLNGEITTDELVENIEDLIHDVEGNDGLDNFTALEDDGFYDEPDFTKLELT